MMTSFYFWSLIPLFISKTQRKSKTILRWAKYFLLKGFTGYFRFRFSARWFLKSDLWPNKIWVKILKFVCCMNENIIGNQRTYNFQISVTKLIIFLFLHSRTHGALVNLGFPSKWRRWAWLWIHKTFGAVTKILLNSENIYFLLKTN